MRQEELKQDQERIKRVPLPTPQSQASSIPLFEQEGSTICDRFYELFSKGRVSPCQDSTPTVLMKISLHTFSDRILKYFFMKIQKDFNTK
jgi:hypothetical protein